MYPWFSQTSQSLTTTPTTTTILITMMMMMMIIIIIIIIIINKALITGYIAITEYVPDYAL
jgi:hypothetical protein